MPLFFDFKQSDGNCTRIGNKADKGLIFRFSVGL